MRLLVTVVLLLVSYAVLADRITDLTSVGGVRPNQLVGYGIVAGLAGTGDGKDPTFTGQSLKAILESLGVTTNPYDDYDLAQSRGRPLQVDNVAAVMVTERAAGRRAVGCACSSSSGTDRVHGSPRSKHAVWIG